MRKRGGRNPQCLRKQRPWMPRCLMPTRRWPLHNQPNGASSTVGTNSKFDGSWGQGYDLVLRPPAFLALIQFIPTVFNYYESVGAGDGNSTRSLTRLLRTSFPIQASRNGLDCGLKSSAWSTQVVAGDPKRAKHIHQQPEHRISFRSLSVYWHTTPQVATDRRAAVLMGLAHHRPARPRLAPDR